MGSGFKRCLIAAVFSAILTSLGFMYYSDTSIQNKVPKKAEQAVKEISTAKKSSLEDFVARYEKIKKYEEMLEKTPDKLKVEMLYEITMFYKESSAQESFHSFAEKLFDQIETNRLSLESNEEDKRKLQLKICKEFVEEYHSNKHRSYLEKPSYLKKVYPNLIKFLANELNDLYELPSVDDKILELENNISKYIEEAFHDLEDEFNDSEEYSCRMLKSRMKVLADRLGMTGVTKHFSLKIYRKLIEINPTDEQTILELAETILRLYDDPFHSSYSEFENYKKELTAIAKKTNVSTSEWQDTLINKIAKLCKEVKFYDKAIKALKKAEPLFQDKEFVFECIWTELAELYHLKGDIKRREEILSQMKKEIKNMDVCYYHDLIETLVAVGYENDAKQIIKKMGPKLCQDSFATTLGHLFRGYRNANNPTAMEGLLKQSKNTLFSEPHYSYLQLAELYFKNQNFKKSLTWYNKALNEAEKRESYMYVRYAQRCIKTVERELRTLN